MKDEPSLDEYLWEFAQWRWRFPQCADDAELERGWNVLGKRARIYAIENIKTHNVISSVAGGAKRQVIFEKGSGKWLELQYQEGGFSMVVRYHSTKRNATLIWDDLFDRYVKLFSLEWLSNTLEMQDPAE